jgi:CMP-N,N'-diacetyllegionaminic acid synthase
MSHETLAIIPARGGSKGIPGKNLRLLASKPLIAHSIEAALHTPSINRVVVSTDDPEIAEAALAYGAEVCIRPPEISGDEATSESALIHVLDEMERADGYQPDMVVFLQATSPHRWVPDIQAAYDLLLEEGADSLFSAGPMHGFVWSRQGADVHSLTYDYHNRQRRQDLGEHVLENGSIYIFKTKILRETGNRLGGRIAVYMMDSLRSLQVDEPGDLEIMEQLLAMTPPAS